MTDKIIAGVVALAALCLSTVGIARTMPAAAPPAAAGVAPPVAATVPPASPPPPSVTIPRAMVRVTLTTSLGPIVLDLESQRAPLSTASFLRYVDQRRLDGTTFYRATNLGRGYGLVQGGTRNDPRRILRPIAHEPTTQTGLSHTDGTISLARGAPGTATADFFITVGDLVALDAHPAQPGDNLGFAAFGHVAEGMDIVRQILAAPTDPTAGEGVMRGQMIAAPIRIISARRSPVVPAAVTTPPH